MTKLVIDRGMKSARVGVDKVLDACWLGQKFATHHPDLVRRGWNVICYPSSDTGLTGSEMYSLEDDGCPSLRTIACWADTIALRIKTPSRHPCCPRCSCDRDL